MSESQYDDRNGEMEQGQERESEPDHEQQALDLTGEGGSAGVRFETRGGVAVHDKRRGNGSEQAGDREATDASIAGFKCPFCEYTDPDEKEVRWHITREDDYKHEERNAFREPIFVHAIDEDGNVIEDRESPREEFKGEVSTQFLPEGVDPETREAEIIETALKTPTSTRTSIAERVYGEDYSQGQYKYVCETVKKHLSGLIADARPGNSGGTGATLTDGELSGFETMTPRQQQAAVGYLDDPDRVKSDSAHVVGLSRQDVYNLLNRQKDIVDALDEKLAAGEITFGQLLEAMDEPPLDAKFTGRGADAIDEVEVETETGTATDTDADTDAGSDTGTVTEADAAAPPSADGDSDSRGTENEQVAEADATADADPAEEMVLVPRDRVRQFAQELDVIHRSAKQDIDLCKRDSERRIAAEKQMFVIDIVDEFLRDVAACTEGDDGAAAGAGGDPDTDTDTDTVRRNE